jgi:hypothetical protein
MAQSTTHHGFDLDLHDMEQTIKYMPQSYRIDEIGLKIVYGSER